VKSPVSSKRFFDSSSREIGNGTEYTAKIEVLREDGSRSLVDALARRTETDGWISVQASFVIQRFASQQDSSPSRKDVVTHIMDTKKGEVEGDHRWHTSQGAFISSDGIFKFPAFSVKVPTATSKKEMSVEEMMEQVAVDWDRV
jgi:hypothetical protein